MKTAKPLMREASAAFHSRSSGGPPVESPGTPVSGVYSLNMAGASSRWRGGPSASIHIGG